MQVSCQSGWRDELMANEEKGSVMWMAHNNAAQIVTSTFAGVTTSYTYDLDGNLVGEVEAPNTRITMGYDKENRLQRYEDGEKIATYLYDGDGLKRVELVNGVRTTIVWDGTDYLQIRSD